MSVLEDIKLGTKGFSVLLLVDLSGEGAGRDDDPQLRHLLERRGPGKALFETINRPSPHYSCPPSTWLP